MLVNRPIQGRDVLAAISLVSGIELAHPPNILGGSAELLITTTPGVRGEMEEERMSDILGLGAVSLVRDGPTSVDIWGYRIA